MFDWFERESQRRKESAKVRTREGKSQRRQGSMQDRIREGKSQRRKESERERVKEGKSQRGKESERERVREGKSQRRKESQMERVRDGKSQRRQGSMQDRIREGKSQRWKESKKERVREGKSQKRKESANINPPHSLLYFNCIHKKQNKIVGTLDSGLGRGAGDNQASQHHHQDSFLHKWALLGTSAPQYGRGQAGILPLPHTLLLSPATRHAPSLHLPLPPPPDVHSDYSIAFIQASRDGYNTTMGNQSIKCDRVTNSLQYSYVTLRGQRLL
nr:hypothetical protein BgiMline_020868 [Biomphalaria glabrata]